MFRQKVAIALAATTAALSIPQRMEATPAALVPAVAACMSTPQCVVAVVTVGGAVYWQVKHTLENPILIPMPVLDDPEAEGEQENWIDYVWADSVAEAQKKCEALARTATHQGGSKVTISNVRQVGKGKRYECTFRG
ncbi:hypothetical protein [Trichocoleus sp. FACHB-262]|uniref:hypothetical protein n=1 Tax=Trichocoleus sp. FACHB-262 TaxID=2692869 RepID=UPI001684AF0C|nr:hypothetical protein [Trichocoleus sp. FACHB-262]MBD2122532.1 hypothetical protein [Trichocoleus sp. FACHB-262]